MAKNKNAKQAAYAKKQEAQAKKVMMWIIGGLMAIAIITVASMMYAMS